MRETEPITPLIEKIARECEEAGATKWQAIKIIKELESEEKAGAQKPRQKALQLLRTLNPEAAKVFESFSKMHVHNSKQLVEPFDRGNIVKSIIQETRANRAIAEKIGAEVEDRIKDLKICHLTTALIREMANAKLLEYGFEELRNKYARLGLPVADIEKEISAGLFENKQILTEYSLSIALPKELGEQHFLANLHVCSIEDFCTKPLGATLAPNVVQNDSVEELVPGLLKQINAKKSFFSLPLNIEALNFQIAFALENESEQKAKQKSAFAISCLGAALCREKHNAIMPLFAPDSIEKSQAVKQNAIKIANRAIASGTGLRVLAAVDSRFCLKALESECFEKELLFLNCSKEELFPLGNETAAANAKGILGMVALNLEKFALENARKESAFEQELLEKTTAAKEIMELKKSELQKRHYLKENGILLEGLKPALGIFNPLGAAALFLEKKESDRETIQFAEKAIKKIRDALGTEWVIADSFEASGQKRFALSNEKEFRHKSEMPENTQAFALRGISTHSTANGKRQLEESIDAGIQMIKFFPEKQQ